MALQAQIIQNNIIQPVTTDDSIIQAIDAHSISGNNKLTLAQKIFKESVNIGEAVVNVLSNTGIAGFKFNIPEREQIKMQSDITDHYTDSNNAVNDHIARKPITVTLTGVQGEYFYSVNKIEDMLSKVIPTLALVKQFLPKLPDGAKQKLLKKYQNLAITDKTPEALQTSSNKNEINNIDLFSLFQSLYKVTSSQTRAYLFLKALWQSKALFSVETTFEKFDNMAVIDLTPLRNDSADMAEFTVTFKQMNFAQTLTRDIDNAIGRTREQLAEINKKGVDKGKEVATI